LRSISANRYGGIFSKRLANCMAIYNGLLEMEHNFS